MFNVFYAWVISVTFYVNKYQIIYKRILWQEQFFSAAFRIKNMKMPLSNNTNQIMNSRTKYNNSAKKSYSSKFQRNTLVLNLAIKLCYLKHPPFIIFIEPLKFIIIVINDNCNLISLFMSFFRWISNVKQIHLIKFLIFL